MLAAQIGAAPTVTNAPLTITLSIPKSDVPYGSQIGYHIKLINRTDHPIDCGQDWSENVDVSYPFDITNTNGKKILPQLGPMMFGHSRSFKLDPGASTSWESALFPSEYPGLIPGEYRIRVSAQNPDNPRAERIYSNTVTIRIEPPPALAPN